MQILIKISKKLLCRIRYRRKQIRYRFRFRSFWLETPISYPKLRYRTRYWRFFSNIVIKVVANRLLGNAGSSDVGTVIGVNSDIGEKIMILGPTYLFYSVLAPLMLAFSGYHVRHRARCEEKYQDIRMLGICRCHG